MKQFTHIIFDLDGTLTDNTLGIKNSLRHALKQMQVDEYSDDILSKFIGPPLQWGFSNLFGMNERNTNLAVEYFRGYYGENGWHQNEPYDGIPELLAGLDHIGKKLYVATAKMEKYAALILQHFEFDKYIRLLKGSDYKGIHADKTGIVAGILEQGQLVASKEIVVVGDTVYDILAGKNNGLSTIAVSYGFGKKAELEQAQPDYFVNDVNELYELLTI